MNKPYFLYSGIKELAKIVTGQENIYLGIRPYGFHAGNMSTLVVYPYLLCQETKKQGTIPQFSFFIFLNDWEQDGLAGPDVKKFPFNIHPQRTTFQYLPSSEDPSKSMADYWSPKIIRKISKVQEKFSQIKIKGIRNSEMKENLIMKKHLLTTINHPELVARVLQEHANREILDEPIVYALAVCPTCKKVKGVTNITNEDNITHICTSCSKVTKGNYEDFDYWFYHKPLALPRLEIFDIDICITGMDHYKEGDYVVRQKLIDIYKSKAKYPLTLYAPTILGENGKVMGKSKENAVNIEFEKLVNIIKKNSNSSKIQIN